MGNAYGNLRTNRRDSRPRPEAMKAQLNDRQFALGHYDLHLLAMMSSTLEYGSKE